MKETNKKLLAETTQIQMANQLLDLFHGVGVSSEIVDELLFQLSKAILAFAKTPDLTLDRAVLSIDKLIDQKKTTTNNYDALIAKYYDLSNTDNKTLSNEKDKKKIKQILFDLATLDLTDKKKYLTIQSLTNNKKMKGGLHEMKTAVENIEKKLAADIKQFSPTTTITDEASVASSSKSFLSSKAPFSRFNSLRRTISSKALGLFSGSKRNLRQSMLISLGPEKEKGKQRLLRR